MGHKYLINWSGIKEAVYTPFQAVLTVIAKLPGITSIIDTV